MNSELINNLSAYFSQSTETLYRFLIDNLYSPQKSPFLKRLILVPSPLMKSWLIKQMADELGVFMGAELFLQEQGMRKVADILGITSPTLVPSIDQLSFAFQLLIPKLSDDYPFLKNYLAEGHQKRLLSLAHEMAELFVDYGTFGEILLEEWERHPEKNWQAALWKLLCSEFPQWGPAYQLYKPPEQPPEATFEIHLFAISYLPAIVVRFLTSLPVPVYFYQLSPTQTFWEDTLTGSQRRYLCKVWEEKGVSAAQLNDLNQYLRDTHPLLANWGKLGRMMVKQLPSDLLNYEERYPLPEKAFSAPEWEERMYPETVPLEKPLTLLAKLQTDLVTMRPIPELPSCCENDHTIQVHQAVCKRREVEEIYNTIASIIARHQYDQDPITPEDVVVMAPEIIEYAPYIQSHFEREESVLDYRLMDIALPTHDPCIRAFRKILSLIHSRWESTTLKDLLQLELFQKRLKIESGDVTKLQKWINENDVIWGMDRKHHADSLTQSHCSEGIEIHQGTWDHFFERTLRGLVTVHGEGVSLGEDDILPYSEIDLNDAELLGKWVETLNSLYDQLKTIESTQTTLLTWSLILETLAKEFLESLSTPLEMIFHQFRQAAVPFATQQFPFDSVLAWFDEIFQKGKTSYREHHINSVRFCSLLPMRAIPAKVVILCGMSDGAFPRVQLETSQNLLKDVKEADPKPKKVDFDRYLMLETILSTRHYFILTYTASEKDQGPSLIINELLDLLDRYYTINQDSVSSQIFYQHPFHRYDFAYFTSQKFKSYSTVAYHEALMAKKPEKQPLKSFIEQFNVAAVPSECSEVFLSLRDLEQLARDPLSFYYKKTLGITLKESEEIKTERNLTLQSIPAAMIPRNALTGDLESEILLHRKNGELPEGVFEELAKRSLRSKSQNLEDNLQKAGAVPDEFFAYTFDRILFTSENHPPIHLSGTIENICPEGLVLHKDGKPEDLYQFIPRILLFHYFVRLGAIPAKARLLFSGSGKYQDLFHPNPKEQIETFLCYWNQAKESPSPLSPNWIKYLLKGDAEGLDTLLNNAFAITYSEYEKANKKFDLIHLMNSPWVEWSRRIYDTPL